MHAKTTWRLLPVHSPVPQSKSSPHSLVIWTPTLSVFTGNEQIAQWFSLHSRVRVSAKSIAAGTVSIVALDYWHRRETRSGRNPFETRSSASVFREVGSLVKRRGDSVRGDSLLLCVLLLVPH